MKSYFLFVAFGLAIQAAATDKGSVSDLLKLWAASDDKKSSSSALLVFVTPVTKGL